MTQESEIARIITKTFQDRVRIEKLGQKTSKEGTEEIEKRLDQLIKAGCNKQINDMLPSEFLESACEQLWQQDKNVEPILYLYEKYFSIRVGKEPDEGPMVGLGFTTVMSKIAAENGGQDRNTIINTTIEFLTRHNDDPVDCIVYIVSFATDLKENGLIKESRNIAYLLKEMHSNILDQWTILKEDVEGLLL